MLADAVMVGDAVPFEKLLQECANLEVKINSTAA
jgi:hypothetical protein